MVCVLQAMFRDSSNNTNHSQVSHTFVDQTIVYFVSCVINFFVQHSEIKQDLTACVLQVMFRDSSNNTNHSQVSHTFVDQTIVYFVSCVINFFVQHSEIKQDLTACVLQVMFRDSSNNANHSQVSHTLFEQTIV